MMVMAMAYSWSTFLISSLVESIVILNHYFKKIEFDIKLAPVPDQNVHFHPDFVDHPSYHLQNLEGVENVNSDIIIKSLRSNFVC